MSLISLFGACQCIFKALGDVHSMQTCYAFASCCAIFLLIGISGCFCPCVLSCYLAKLYGENFMTALLPGGLTALRTHIRLSYKIEGTVCNDALIICCCGPCEVCRMTREVRKHVQ
uniref:Uncharacterized protein n=1 Tax=Callorhinchus milii TaxID=7868 RepID=A0A4W3JG74_CALMI